MYIADRRREKASIRTTAAELGRNPSAIGREMRRNGMPLRGDASRWAYRPHAARARAGARSPGTSARTLTAGLHLGPPGNAVEP